MTGAHHHSRASLIRAKPSRGHHRERAIRARGRGNSIDGSHAEPPSTKPRGDDGASNCDRGRTAAAVYHLAPSHRFVRAVRDAFRSYHEARNLVRSELLEMPMILNTVQPGLGRIALLQSCLARYVHQLATNVKTQPLARALRHAFIEPAGSQVLAAERCRTSYGTFRRHLAAGIIEVATLLWLERTLGED